MGENEIREKLKSYGQEHLMLKYDSMNAEDKTKLLNQLSSIDFEQIKNLYDMTKKQIEIGHDRIEPISYVDKNTLSDEEKIHYNEIGENAIKQGKLGFITMAGGQRNKAWT